MNLSESSSIVYQGGVTGSSTSSVTNITRDNQAIFNSGKTITVTNMSSSSSESERIISGITVVADGVITGAGIASQHQTKEKVVAQRRQTQSIVHKTLINIKLSITRYERADAALATPNAKPGTLMLSQVEMLGSAPDINISGSAFSHVRESSKGRAVPSSESAPRELSLRWMKNESQWKREAGMLQKLKSDKYIVEHFRLYTLPTFAEYRFVSVLGPFTSTLESYSKERKSNTSVQQGSSSRASPPLSRGPLTLAEIKAIADSIASALKWCHDNRVVHLNLTPESIFLQEFYSEPDGQGGYRTSFYSSYSNKSQDATTGTGSEVPRIEHHWKLWNFGNARFVHEAVDLNVDMTPYTAPEILLASRRNQQRTEVSTIVAPQDPNKDTSVVTTVSADGVVTITTTRSTSGTAETSNRGPEELKAATSMDMWSLGGILYEMYTSQPMFTSSEDALVKLTSALEKGEAEGTEDDDDLDKAEAHDKIRQQLQDQIEKIEGIEDKGAREAIASLVKLEPERRWDHALLRECYFDMQE
ncbi:kinase-like domain-containing protein [Dissophora ornata]|nr:kinase-like domain-containing protein [Dissophora ornata]